MDIIVIIIDGLNINKYRKKGRFYRSEFISDLKILFYLF